MTERDARGDLDLDYPFDNPDDHDGWYGYAEVTEPAPTPDVEGMQQEDSHDNGGEDPADTDRWYVQAPAADPTYDVDDLLPDESHNNGWDNNPATDASNGQAQVADPTHTRDVDDLPPEDSQDDWWDDPATDEAPWRDLYAPRNPRVNAPGIGAWTFTLSTRRPWYRSKKHVMTALIATAVAAVAASGVLLVLRSPATAVEESTTVSPQAPTSAAPAPTSAAPSLSPALPPPPASPAPTSEAPSLSPALPPPPASPAPTSEAPSLSPALPPPPASPAPPAAPAPPPTQVDNGPVISEPDYQPRQSAPDQTDKPEIGVTRTPATRAPISATPPPPPSPGRNSGTPGDATPGRGWNPF